MPSTSHTTDGGLCEICLIVEPLREKVYALLGAPSDGALSALGKEELRRGIGLLDPETRRSVLGDLGMGGGRRKLSDASLSFAALKVSQQPARKRERLAFMLCWPVWTDLYDRALELDDRDDMPPTLSSFQEAIGELIPRHSRGLVRLALATCWDEGPGGHLVYPAALEALLSDEHLTLPGWATGAAEALAGCAEADARLRALAHAIQEEDADRWDKDAVIEAALKPVDIDDSQAQLASFTREREESVAALASLMEEIAAGGRIDLASLEPVVSLHTRHRTAALVLELDPDSATIAEVEAMLAERGARDAARSRLARAGRMEGPPVAAEAISRVKFLAAELQGRPEWGDEDRKLAAALTALLDLSECDPQDVSTLIALDSAARAGLPADLAALCTLAGRGLRLGDAPAAGALKEPAPADAAADEDAGEETGAEAEAADEDEDAPAAHRGPTEPAPTGQDAPVAVGPAPAPEPEPAPVVESPPAAASEPGSEPVVEAPPVASPEPQPATVEAPTVAHASVVAPTPTPAPAHVPPAAPAVPESSMPAPAGEADHAAGAAPIATEVAQTQEAAGLWTPEELSAQIAALLGEGRLGLAYWVATSGGRLQAGRDALRVAALSAGMRSGSGPIAARLAEILPGLRVSDLEGDRPGQLLVLAVAFRASLLAPYPGEADDVMQELGETFSQEAPSLAALAQAAREASLAGVTLAAEDLSRGRDLAEMEQAIQSAREAGGEMLKRPRSLSFQRASVIWRRWTSDGIIQRLLDAVAEDRRSARESVSQLALRLHTRAEVDREIDSIDRALRGSGSDRLEGRARRHLVSLVAEAVEIASSWSDAVAALEQRRPEAAGPFANLRRAAAEQRGAMRAELGRLSEGPSAEMAGAARAACRQMEATLDLLDGVALPGGELAPELTLGADLLLMPQIELSADLSPRVGALGPADCATAPEAPVEALEKRMARHDFLGARAVIDLMKARDEDLGALVSRVNEHEGSMRQDVAARADEVRVRLDRARRQNYLTEDEWRDLTGALQRAEDTKRLDLDVVLTEIQKLSIDLETMRANAQERFTRRLDARRRESQLVEEVAERIAKLLEAGDLATAEEYLVLAEAGEQLPSGEHAPDHLGAFFPAVPRALADVGAEQLLRAAERGERLGPLDFGAVAEQQRKVAHRALEAWYGAFRTKGPEVSKLMLTALRLAGIEAPTLRSARVTGGRNRIWADLVGVQRTGLSLVPAFGSASGDTLRVLICLSAEPATLMSWVSQDPSDCPVVVLHRGVISPARRRELADLNRREQRAVIVIDDAAMAYLAAQGDRRFDTTMRITLPFAATNPYQPEMAGNVPAEMFYGRSEERARVIDRAGTSLIYGGRQLGKSALLRSAARRFELTPGQVALYVDVAAAEIATRRDPGLIWTLLYKALTDRGIGASNPRRPSAATVQEAVGAWLAEGAERRLLLLLDECDTFFDQDAQRGFQNTIVMRKLMEDTSRRCKVVFAGLHQVQRFAGIPNQPLAHLGKPEAIGPLAASQAFALLQVPLEALGFRIDEDLVARVLAYTNYSPLNLQLFGRALVRQLLSRPLPAEGPPWIVSEADIESVAEAPGLQSEIRERFHYTLSLDPRYRVIGYVMAYRTYEDAPGTPLKLGDLRRECDEWWPAGFAGLSADEFRALVEEMRGLGVLAVAQSGGFIMRSPAVLRMLGTYEEVIEELVRVEAKELPPAGFLAALARRPLGAGDPTCRSPMSEQQLAELVVERRTGSYLAIGSEATGIDRVAAAIIQAAAAIAQPEWVVIANKRADFEKALSEGEQGQHRVIISDLTKVSEAGFRHSLELSTQIQPPVGVTRSAVFVGGPSELWAELLERPLDRLELIELRRYDQSALEAWAIDEERAFQDPESRARLLTLTGGWPNLVERVSVRIHKSGDDAGAALAWLEQWLASEAGAASFLDEVGLDDDLELAGAYRAVAETVAEPEDAEQLVDLVSGLHPHPRGAIGVLRALGILTVSERGYLAPEPVMRRIWGAARS